MTAKRTNAEFITEAKVIHGDKYNYDLVNYVNNATHVDIQCNKCSKLFSITPMLHLNRKVGCPFCNPRRSNVKITKEVFLEKADKVHNSKFTYLDLDFKDVRDKVKWKCNTCGNIHSQIVYSHLRGAGCPVCNNKAIFKKDKDLTTTNQVVDTNDLSFHIKSIYYHLKQIENLKK